MLQAVVSPVVPEWVRTDCCVCSSSFLLLASPSVQKAVAILNTPIKGGTFSVRATTIFMRYLLAVAVGEVGFRNEIRTRRVPDRGRQQITHKIGLRSPIHNCLRFFGKREVTPWDVKPSFAPNLEGLSSIASTVVPRDTHRTCTMSSRSRTLTLSFLRVLCKERVVGFGTSDFTLTTSRGVERLCRSHHRLIVHRDPCCTPTTTSPRFLRRKPFVFYAGKTSLLWRFHRRTNRIGR